MITTPAMDRARPAETDLFSRAAKPDSAKIAPSDPRIDAMLAYLRGKGWVKRDQVFAAIGVSDRVGRALKAECGGLIISDSQKGYRHILDATPNEFHHAANEIRSRVRELQSYLVEMERIYHSEGQAA